jgi:hypothetical protein
MVNALQIMKKEPTANTVPGNHVEVALNNEPNAIGPRTRRQCLDQKHCTYTKRKHLPNAAVKADMRPNAA